MDRHLFKKSFTKNGGITFPCPTCGNFSLQLDKGTFHTSDSAASRKMMREQSYWEEEWISSIYTAIFVCQNLNCEEHVVSSGTGFVSQEPIFTQDDRYTYTTFEYVCFYKPKFFQPALHFLKFQIIVQKILSLHYLKHFLSLYFPLVLRLIKFVYLLKIYLLILIFLKPRLISKKESSVKFRCKN